MNVDIRPQNALAILSLCTGGAGLDLGVELAMPGARTVCMVEREAFACGHLVAAMQQGLLAEAPVWSDARTFDGRRWRGCVDGLIGGIPCQPHSLAGKRQGAADARDLWSCARRIIVQSGAWFVLIENVRGMLSSGGAERVWRDLRRLGFKVEGGLFTAAEIGASHERERLFILAVRDGHALVHAECAERWPGNAVGCEPDWGDGGWNQAAGRIGKPSETLASGTPRRYVDDASGGGNERGLGDKAGTQRAPSGGVHVVEPDQGRGWADDINAGRSPGLFPPGPGDIAGWRDILDRAPQLEPAVRGMADGVASRVDALRMLGNGVVPLEAAYAVRTLASRLAAGGSAGAARLVRMMGREP